MDKLLNKIDTLSIPRIATYLSGLKHKYESVFNQLNF